MGSQRARSDSASWRRTETEIAVQNSNESNAETETEQSHHRHSSQTSVLTDAESDTLCDILHDQMSQSQHRGSNEWTGSTVYPWSPYHPQFVGALPMNSVSAGSNLAPYNLSYGK